MPTQIEGLREAIKHLEETSGPDGLFVQQLKLQLASYERRERRQADSPEESLWRWQMGFHPK